MELDISKIMPKFICSILLLITFIILIINGIAVNESINYSEKIEGTLIDYKTITFINTKHCPKYEYKIDGKNQLYISNVCNKNKIAEKTKTLYYNKNTKKIAEPVEVKSIFLLAYLTLIITIPMLITSITSMIRYKNKDILNEYGDL